MRVRKLLNTLLHLEILATCDIGSIPLDRTSEHRM